MGVQCLEILQLNVFQMELLIVKRVSCSYIGNIGLRYVNRNRSEAKFQSRHQFLFKKFWFSLKLPKFKVKSMYITSLQFFEAKRDMS